MPGQTHKLWWCSKSKMPETQSDTAGADSRRVRDSRQPSCADLSNMVLVSGSLPVSIPLMRISCLLSCALPAGRPGMLAANGHFCQRTSSSSSLAQVSLGSRSGQHQCLQGAHSRCPQA